jgi:hypothetical protein
MQLGHDKIYANYFGDNIIYIVDSLKVIQDEQKFILENYGHIYCP